jgi:uncharacterized membrane protein
MAESEGGFSKGRLEAFSDGVIAVVMTIMVLDLKAPESAEPADLLKLWPSFTIYLVSYGFVAIYWINHHRLLSHARQVTASLIWANASLLFSLSLIPFATAYVASTRIAPFPTAIYGALQFACALCFSLTGTVIEGLRGDDPAFRREVEASRPKDRLSLAAYALGTAMALFSPLSAIAIFVAIGVVYIVPSLFAEHPLGKARREPGA